MDYMDNENLPNQPTETEQEGLDQGAIDYQPNATAENAGAEAEPKGLFELLYGVIAKPVETLRYLAETKPWVKGIIAYALVSLIVSIANLPGAIQQSRDLGGLDRGLPPGLSGDALIAISAFAVAITPFIALLFITTTAGVFHVIARMLKGNGDVLGLISALGFSSFPQILAVPIALLDFIGGTVISIVTGVTTLAFLLWVIVLNILAIRETYKFSTGKAVVTFLAPLGIFIVVIVLFAVLIAGAFFTAMGGAAR